MKSKLTLVLFISLPLSVNSQSFKTYTWADDCCEYEGKYDPNKVTEIQLRNTFNLYYWGYSLDTKQSAFQLKDVAKLNADSLANEYARKTIQITNLDIIPGKYWDNYRKDKLKEFNQVYYRKRLTILAHTDPTVLLTYNTKDSCIRYYGRAIAMGGDSLLAAWKDLLEAQCAKNAYPEKLRAKFADMYNSPDRGIYAAMEVINFGWWNCVNRTVEYTSQTHTDANKKFRDAFINVKELGCGCD